MNQIQEIARAAGITPFDWSGSYYGSTLTKTAARLTEGRTHYFDEGTRKYFGASVVHLSVLCDGLVLGAVERVSADSDHSHKVYRPVFFRADGTVFDRPDIDSAYPTKAKALKAFWELANVQDARVILRGMLEENIKRAQRQLSASVDSLVKLSAAGVQS